MIAPPPGVHVWLACGVTDMRKPVISGSVLYGLAKPGDGESVFLEVPGGEDRLTEHGELIDLTEPRIERFITAPKRPPTFEIIVNSRPRTVNARTVTFEQIVQLAFPGKRAERRL